MSKPEISEIRGTGGIDTPKLPGLGRPERRMPGQPEGHRPLSRRQRTWITWTGVTLAAGAALGVGINAAVNQESSDQNPVDTTAITSPTTIPENTTVPPVTSTTEKSTTTTTEMPTTTTEVTTTTTEQVTGIDAELESKVKTLNDVTGEIKIGKFLEKPVMKIDAELQNLFQSKNPNESIVYVGKANMGDKMNAVKTTKDITYIGKNVAVFTNFFGGEMSKIKEGTDQAFGEFKDVILIPGSNDFYIRAQNPLTNEDFYARILIDKSYNHRNVQTLNFVFNLATKDQPYSWENGKLNTDHYILMSNFLSKHKLSEFIQPGDIIGIYFNSFNFIATKDNKGVQLANYLIIERFNGVSEIESLYK